MVLKDLRLSNDLRNLVRYHPDTKFTAEDLTNIINNQTIKVYERLGTSVEEKPLPDQIGDINENKNRFLGKESPKRSFSETPNSPKEWLDRLNKIKSELGLPEETSLNDLREELKRLSSKSKATKKSVGLKNSDIKYLIENIKIDQSDDTDYKPPY